MTALRDQTVPNEQLSRISWTSLAHCPSRNVEAEVRDRSRGVSVPARAKNLTFCEFRELRGPHKLCPGLLSNQWAFSAPSRQNCDYGASAR